MKTFLKIATAFSLVIGATYLSEAFAITITVTQRHPDGGKIAERNIVYQYQNYNELVNQINKELPSIHYNYKLMMCTDALYGKKEYKVITPATLIPNNSKVDIIPLTSGFKSPCP